MSNAFMPYQMKTWNPAQLRISFAGIQISRGAGASGYAEDEFLSAKPINESFTDVLGCDGTVTRNATNSRLWEIKLQTLQTNSITNGALSVILASDEASFNGNGVAPFVAQDLNGTTQLECLRAWLTGWPEMVFGKQAKARVWTMHAVADLIVCGGN